MGVRLDFTWSERRSAPTDSLSSLAGGIDGAPSKRSGARSAPGRSRVSSITSAKLRSGAAGWGAAVATPAWTGSPARPTGLRPKILASSIAGSFGRVTSPRERGGLRRGWFRRSSGDTSKPGPGRAASASVGDARSRQVR